ncbi:MAG: copper chaperone PCu(A)C [Thermodesulfovibrionales bacterium]
MLKGVVSVFMRISNSGGKDYLTGARTDINGSIVELHDVKNGRMVKVNSIKIPSEGKVEMIPGGIHIMIFNLPDNIIKGNEINLYLRFDKT